MLSGRGEFSRRPISARAAAPVIEIGMALIRRALAD
jgi:hypothetical protein